MKSLIHDGSYSVSDIEGYFKYIFEKLETVIDNSSIMICVNKIENNIMFKIKTGYYFELLTPETIKLLRSTKSKIAKDKSGANLTHLEITEVVLKNCNIVSKYYHQDSRVLYIFVPNKSLGQLLAISSKNSIFLKTLNSDFSYIEVQFTDQNSKPLQIEDKINITLIIN